MHEDHEDEVVNRNEIWSGTRAPGKAQGQRSALVRTLSLCKTFYVTIFVLLKHVTFMYACTGLILTYLCLIYFYSAGEAGEAHAGQLGQCIGCMVRIEYGKGVPVGG